MASKLTILLVLLVVLVVCLPGNGVYAFGAGNIPSFAYMEGRAFRHGDIEDTLAELVKKAGGFSLGAMIGKGSKFGGLDIKRVYFGNWLRDYSQAVDIASLKKLQIQTIINLCMALGFLAHGYATNEFEVTPERLGCYLPTEHIDNPKGYGDGEDARKYHPGLRGPVDPRELEVDPQTGMKNYIANEHGSWDTSKALVRRTLEKCIHLGRQHRSQGQKQDEYEAYRLLGQLLHTLEDFTAHSNFCELALVSMGHQSVFLHVGDNVRVHAPNGKRVAPLVTGTFGSSDFIHSLLGEATDHISEASVSDLNKELDKARTKSRSGPGDNGGNPADTVRNLLFQIPGGGGGEMSREMDSIERIRAGPAAGGKRPEDMSPQELHAVLWQVLAFRDSVVKKIEKTIEKIPGLGPLIEKLMDSISVFIFTTLEPYLKPIMKTATTGLMSASGEVIDTHDQYEVFNDPSASDPTHSFLSKDHFNLILNEPAGSIAKVVVGHTVRQVVKAWDDNSVNVHNVTEEVLQCLFHPDFHNPNSQVQREMMLMMRKWVDGLGHKQHEVLSRLTREQVRNHKNIRAGGEGGHSSAEGSAPWNAAHDAQQHIQGYMNAIPGVAQAQSMMHSFQGGPMRDGPGGGAYGTPGGSGYAPPSGPPPGGPYSMPVSASGEAASFYSEGASGKSPAPSGPPPRVHHDSRPGFPDAPSSGQPPYGAPPDSRPSFPSFPGGGDSHSQHGYSPSYTSPPSGPPPSFPSGPGGYASPPSFPSPGPSGPGGYGMPGGGPPPFPGGGPMFPSAGPFSPPPGPPGPPTFPQGPGGNYYGNPPQGGYQPPPGPPGGW